MTDPGRNEALRVAIVGLGPKGMYALERLIDRAATTECARAIVIEAFEPHDVPGAGPIYDPGQPDYLRMNFAADRIDVWPPGSRSVRAGQRLSFQAWRARQAGLGDDAYPPRGQVGHYLADCLGALVDHVPEPLSVRIRPQRVTAVVPTGTKWEVRCGDSRAEFDEVILATGHASDWAGSLRRNWDHAASLVDAVFPVETTLTTAAVRPGSRVAARGFALTFIDLALALTEGRGGAFEPDGSRLRYIRSGLEPAVIAPFSRTGLPMLAKPDPASGSGSEAWQLEAIRVRDDILAIDDSHPVGELSAAIARLGAHPGNPGDGAAGAQGAAWRSVYPAVVERFGGDGLAAADWLDFRALAAEMERVAFGPPPLNVTKLDALIAAEIVDPAHSRAGHIATVDGRSELRSDAGRVAVDIVVDAVLPPPGLVGVDDPICGPLVAGGYARILPGRRGIEVGDDASCVGADGATTRGLSACGRLTEDSVIGNDTLSRHLHPQLDRWADRVVAQARAPIATGVA